MAPAYQALVAEATNDIERLEYELSMAEERCETWKQQCGRDQEELRTLKARIAEQAKRNREAANVMRVSTDGAAQGHTRQHALSLHTAYVTEAQALEKMLGGL
jgi:hypothetical protein